MCRTCLSVGEDACLVAVHHARHQPFHFRPHLTLPSTIHTRPTLSQRIQPHAKGKACSLKEGLTCVEVGPKTLSSSKVLGVAPGEDRRLTSLHDDWVTAGGRAPAAH